MSYIDGFVIAVPTPGNPPMPFDGQRMIFGGFEAVVEVNNACSQSRLATSTA